MNDAAVRVIDALAPGRRRFLDYARARVGPDAEDVVQAAFVRAALKADTLRDPDRVVPWFFQILRRAVADQRSRLAGDRLTEPLDEEAAGDDEAPPAVCGCSIGLLARIRPEYADIVRRVDLEEQSLAEVAGMLGITPGNAAVRLHRARKSLREALLAFCGTDSMRACVGCGCDA